MFARVLALAAFGLVVAVTGPIIADDKPPEKSIDLTVGSPAPMFAGTDPEPVDIRSRAGCEDRLQEHEGHPGRRREGHHRVHRERPGEEVNPKSESNPDLVRISDFGIRIYSFGRRQREGNRGPGPG